MQQPDAIARHREALQRFLDRCEKGFDGSADAEHDDWYAIPPEQVADIVKDWPRYWLSPGEDLAARLRNDWPLRHVCLACRLFGA
jgi:hypothetical protein